MYVNNIVNRELKPREKLYSQKTYFKQLSDKTKKLFDNHIVLKNKYIIDLETGVEDVISYGCNEYCLKHFGYKELYKNLFHD